MPLPTTGLFARYLANTGVTSSGSPAKVSQWDDQSGGGNHATQGTSGNQPLVITDHLGRTCIRFTATGTTFMDVPGTHLARLISVFVIGRVGGGASGTFLGLVSYAGSAGTMRMVVSASTAPLFYSANRASTLKPHWNPGLLGAISGAAASQVVNEAGSVSLSAVTNDATARALQIGRYNTSYARFDAYEILVYDAALSNTDRDDLIAYAVSTYGLTTSYSQQVLFEGDSITAGSGLPEQDNSYPAQVLDSTTEAWRQLTLASSGSTISSLNTRALQTDAVLEASGFSRQILMVLIGRNDVTAADNSATVYSNLVSYVTARVAAGWEVWVGTLIASGASLQGTIDAYNAKIRGTSGNGIIVDAGATKVVDFGALPEFDATGDSSSGTYYQGDATHPTQAGAALMANLFRNELVGGFNPGLQTGFGFFA